MSFSGRRTTTPLTLTALQKCVSVALLTRSYRGVFGAGERATCSSNNLWSRVFSTSWESVEARALDLDSLPCTALCFSRGGGIAYFD